MAQANEHSQTRARQRGPSGAPAFRRPPHIVEEHPVVDEYGDTRLEATDELGRRWYQLRPRPARTYDVAGFGAFWWAVLWIVVIGLIVWGWGWGWAT